jgi:hypothetical protein
MTDSINLLDTLADVTTLRYFGIDRTTAFGRTGKQSQ